MTTILLNILCITFLNVFIIDKSGFIDNIENILTKLCHSKFQLHIPKPFSCSLCMTFWCGLIYLLIEHSFTLPMISYVCLCSVFTTVINDLINLIINQLTNLISFLYKK